MADQNLQQATLGGGCFWCIEAIFADLQGVVEVLPGYAGGDVENPSYELVCTGTTNHAEVVQITFDPERISYAELLEVFFRVHDPTTPNRQGDDIGTQYRSVIFYHNQEQQQLAEEAIAANQGLWDDPIVTEEEAFTKIYPAEDYHLEYFKNNTNQSNYRLVINPKVTKFRTEFKAKLK